VAEEIISWIQNKVPAWFLLVIASIGTPTAIGSAIWQQNNEARLALINNKIEALQENHQQVWAEIALRARTSERLEMRAELERRIMRLETQLDNLRRLQRE
jgi:hypothetical protein